MLSTISYNMDKLFKEIIYKKVIEIIEKFRDKEFNNAQEEELVLEATMIKVFLEQGDKIIEKALSSNIKEDSQTAENLTEETKSILIESFLSKNKLYNRIKLNYEKYREALESLDTSIFVNEWHKKEGHQIGLDKYFNTPDDLFNSKAFYWRFGAIEKDIFTEIEVLYKIMMRYFDIKVMYDKPIMCADLIMGDCQNNNLSNEETKFVLDNFTEMLFSSEDTKLINVFIELTDRRHNLFPYDEEPDFEENLWDLEILREKAKQFPTILEKIKFYRLQKLEYEKQSRELKFDIGVGKEIDIEIQYWEAVLSKVEEFDMDKIINSEIFSLITVNGFYQIIDFILTLGKNLEKYSDLTSYLDEEKCRDYFLPALNSVSKKHFAGGEIFNKRGRTDILLQDVNGNNIFIAECKIWNGSKYLLEAISQLLNNYINWRDEKVAIIIFNKYMSNFSSLISSAIDTLKGHHNFKEFKGQRKETSFSFIFNHPLDENKEINMELIIFNFKN